MTQEEKQILFKDISARLPYGVKVLYQNEIGTIDSLCSDSKLLLKNECGTLLPDGDTLFADIEDVKPYLRPMSSMTKVEKAVYRHHQILVRRVGLTFEYNIAFTIEWLIEHHFDFLGLIDRGLALDAPEGMYNLNN